MKERIRCGGSSVSFWPLLFKEMRCQLHGERVAPLDRMFDMTANKLFLSVPGVKPRLLSCFSWATPAHICVLNWSALYISGFNIAIICRLSFRTAVKQQATTTSICPCASSNPLRKLSTEHKRLLKKNKERCFFTSPRPPQPVGTLTLSNES